MNPFLQQDAPRPKTKLADWWPLVLVIAFALFWARSFYFKENLPPFEDAAMLLRYAQHVADGHGIVWNVGQAPVDGATDFGFMMLVAGLSKTGLGVAGAARMLTLLAHLLTVALVYRLHLRWREPARADRIWGATLSALVVATGPGLNYCEALFGTPVFALAGLATLGCFIRLHEDGYSARNAFGFAALGLATGLIRPEGVVIVLAMLASLLWQMPAPQRGPLLKAFFLVFGLPGLAYFTWHWVYFGYPLPNPFYVKGGGTLHWASLKASAIGLLKMGNVLLPIFFLALLKREHHKRMVAYLLPIVVFAGAWILMSNAMNFSFRFQYVLMPMLWVLWWPAVEALRNRGTEAGVLGKGRTSMAVAITVLVVGYQGYAFAYFPRIHQDGRAELGLLLTEWKDKGYMMAVTEAGNLPFYSEWPTIDLWGLNDSHIAHSGRVDRAYFEAFKPALVMVHDYWSPGLPKLRPEEKWALMTDSLESFMRQDGYELVACWGREPRNTHFYYLRPTIPAADYHRLKDLLAHFPYRWYEDGLEADNFLRMGE